MGPVGPCGDRQTEGVEFSTRLSVALVAAALAVGACGGSDDAGPEFVNEESTSSATYSYTIPLGAGDAIDAGEPLAILPGELDVSVGESIEIVNLDDRGHNLGPWFVGANETLRQVFAAEGTFEGACTVHPSGQLVLRVSA